MKKLYMRKRKKLDGVDRPRRFSLGLPSLPTLSVTDLDFATQPRLSSLYSFFLRLLVYKILYYYRNLAQILVFILIIRYLYSAYYTIPFLLSSSSNIFLNCALIKKHHVPPTVEYCVYVYIMVP